MILESAVHQNKSKDVKVLLVDDQQNVRIGLRMLLQLEPGATVIGEAGTGAEAVELARVLNPDVVIMDVEMPGIDGIAAARQCIGLWPHCIIIILTIHDRPEVRERALSAGAWAFVEKGKPQELRDAYRQALGVLRPSKLA